LHIIYRFGKTPRVELPNNKGACRLNISSLECNRCFITGRTQNKWTVSRSSYSTTYARWYPPPCLLERVVVACTLREMEGLSGWGSPCGVDKSLMNLVLERKHKLRVGNRSFENCFSLDMRRVKTV